MTMPWAVELLVSMGIGAWVWPISSSMVRRTLAVDEEFSTCGIGNRGNKILHDGGNSVDGAIGLSLR